MNIAISTPIYYIVLQTISLLQLAIVYKVSIFKNLRRSQPFSSFRTRKILMFPNNDDDDPKIFTFTQENFTHIPFLNLMVA